jgi:hypothetical protein
MTHAAAGAACLFYFDFPVAHVQRRRAYRAMIHADRAFLSDGAEARLLIPDRGPDIDLIAWRPHQRAAGTILHAAQSVAKDARRRLDIDVRDAFAFDAVGIDFNALNRTDVHAGAAPAARIVKSLFLQCARRTNPIRHNRLFE